MDELERLKNGAAAAADAAADAADDAWRAADGAAAAAAAAAADAWRATATADAAAAYSADITLLATEGEQWLRLHKYDGVLDRLKNSGIIS